MTELKHKLLLLKKKYKRISEATSNKVLHTG